MNKNELATSLNEYTASATHTERAKAYHIELQNDGTYFAKLSVDGHEGDAYDGECEYYYDMFEYRNGSWRFVGSKC